MSISQPSTQSAAERRSAEAELRGLIVKFASAHQRLIAAVRRSLRKRLPTAHEVVYEYRDCFVISFSPNEHGYEGVLAKGNRYPANREGRRAVVLNGGHCNRVSAETINNGIRLQSVWNG